MVCIIDYYITDSSGYTERTPRYFKNQKYSVACHWVGDTLEQNVYILNGGLTLTHDELIKYFQDISDWRDNVIDIILKK